MKRTPLLAPRAGEAMMAGAHWPLTVIKLGGSLLTLSNLGSRLTGLLASQSHRRPLFVVGGGVFVDQLRHFAVEHKLGEDVCHRLAIQLMSITAELTTQIVPAMVVDHPGEAAVQWRAGQYPVLRMEKWLERPESHSDDLPHLWDTTSDSLAALVARTWNADELWLLKSTDLPDSISVHDASDAGLVDRSFPVAAQGVPQVWWCNLRADQPELRRWW